MTEPLPFDLDSVVLPPALTLGELLRSVERQIASAPVEIGFAFDQAGNVVAKRVGQVASLRFFTDDMRAMQDAILTHNHPNRGFFSFADVEFACYVGLHEIRAVAGRRLYRLSRPADGWDFPAFGTAYENSRRRIVHNYQQRRISRREAESRMNNLVYVVVKQVSLPFKEEKL